MKENKVDKVEINIYDGGQGSFAFDNGQINATQNNNSSNDIQQKIKSRTQEYADKWNENMFLNNFSEWDEKAGINVRLKDVYLEFHLPYFVFKGNTKKISIDLKKFLSQYIVEKNENQMLLILGQPGIGKSTLITWITANFIDNILVYQFASDLKNINWNNTSKDYDLPNEIIRELNLNYRDLDEKVLILDGFDEINIENERAEILNQLYWKLIKDGSLKNFSLMITCRENYIQSLHKVKCNYITLQAWSEKQIESFCTIYQKKTASNLSENTMKRVLKNKDIFGIPLILYMVLALNISIEEEGSVVDVYDQIFSLEGGIYDRCINNDSYASPHSKIKQIKNQIHQISREFAIWIFENNSDEAYIFQSEYSEICKKIQRGIEYDSLIGSFFKLKHCEDIGDKLYFVHRSIYEYFVAETIYSSIKNTMKEFSENSQKELAGNIVIYLKQGEISNIIGEYLKHKIIKLYNKLNNKEKEGFYSWWENAVNKMMAVGMFYYTKENIQNYKNIIHKEITCFINLIEILRLLRNIGKKKYIMESVNKKQLEQYIKYCSIEDKIALDLRYIDLSVLDLERVNLIKVDLREANLVKTNLVKADLTGVNLREADLREANLTEADLTGANLTETDLTGTDLTETDLTEANLREALFDEEQVNYLENKYDLQQVRVYIEKTNEIVTYEEYCSKKKNK